MGTRVHELQRVAADVGWFWRVLGVSTPDHLRCTPTGLLRRRNDVIWGHFRSWITGSSSVVPRAENRTWNQLEYFSLSKSNFIRWLDCNLSVVKTAQIETFFFVCFGLCHSPGRFRFCFLHSGHLILYRELRGHMKFEVTLENWSQTKQPRGFVLIYLLWEEFSLCLSQPSSFFRRFWYKPSLFSWLRLSYRWDLRGYWTERDSEDEGLAVHHNLVDIPSKSRWLASRIYVAFFKSSLLHLSGFFFFFVVFLFVFLLPN